jgi:hypothetical protein
VVAALPAIDPRQLSGPAQWIAQEDAVLQSIALHARAPTQSIWQGTSGAHVTPPLQASSPQVT